MNEEDRHKREMNLNAHFAWGLAMWGSADVARDEGLYLPASIGYYYSAFHACFAAINSNTKIPVESLARTRHAKLEEWIGDFLPGWIPLCFTELRALREGMNYLGLGDPISKLRVVQGGPLFIKSGAGDLTFLAAIERARTLSLIVLRETLNHLQKWGAANGVVVPKREDPEKYWLETYMQEDFLASVLPSDDRMRSRVLARVYYPLTAGAEAETRVTNPPAEIAGDKGGQPGGQHGKS